MQMGDCWGTVVLRGRDRGAVVTVLKPCSNQQHECVGCISMGGGKLKLVKNVP